MSGPETHAMWTIALLAHASQRGLDADAVAVGVGLDAAALADPLARIPLRAHYDALEAVAEALDDSDLGLALGRGLDEGALDALAFFGATARTLGEGLSALLAFLPAGGERFELEARDGEARLRYCPWGPPRPAHDLRAASFVADIVTNVLGPAGVVPRAVHLPTIAPPRLDAARHALGVSVEGGAPAAEVRFDEAALALPSRRPDPAMHRFFEGYLRAKGAPEGASLTERVCRLVDARLPAGPLDAASIARALGASPRTLQRHLRQEGTSLRRLIDERRRLRARAALDAGRSPSEAAFEAGYSEASALHRALRRAGRD